MRKSIMGLAAMEWIAARLEWQEGSLVDTLHVSYIIKGATINYWNIVEGRPPVTWIQLGHSSKEAKRGTPGPAFCSRSADRTKLRYRCL
jgi:hypothetical protein